MNATDTDIDLELILLEDEIKCESPHVFVKKCSVEVAYIVSDCKNSYKVCRNAVEDPEKGTLVRRDAKNVNCHYCKRPPAVCWKILPI